MTVCESCKELCDGLGPLCYECQDLYDRMDDEWENPEFEPIPCGTERSEKCK